VPEYNVDRIRQIMGEINSALHKLTCYAEISEREFLSNPEKVDSAKYNLIVAIEGAMDICNSIVARAGGRAPKDHADCFEVLGELDFLEDEFVEKLKRMARFRNLLVHLYWKVDDKKIHQILKEDIRDIKEYLKIINKAVT
jgi:uncharacterized protein YutE (UPF0331/DUF86 family)